MARVRVIIHYQTALFASGLARLLQKAPGISIAGMMDDLPEAIRMVEELQPEVIVVEGGEGREEVVSCCEFLRRSPNSRVVTLRLDQPTVRLCQCQELLVPDVRDLIAVVRGKTPLPARKSRPPPAA
ncbi:MAG: hypothetical protein HYV08_18530 [Deltaproteobacteria bacterium]|nr:hypothetical protein [Deltaproteobacteria bacterium]